MEFFYKYYSQSVESKNVEPTDMEDRLYKDLKLKNKRQLKWAKGLHKHFSREDIQATNNHLKVYHRAMQLKITNGTVSHQGLPMWH